MNKKENIGISVPSNFIGGPQKLAALAAIDFASLGHNVSIYIPIMPYTFQFLRIQKKPFEWIKLSIKFFIKWICNGHYSHNDLFTDGVNNNLLKIKPVLIRASSKLCSENDYLIFFTEAQIFEYKNIMPAERQIFMLCHPSEYAYGKAEIFSNLRRSFKGKTIAISEFSAGRISNWRKEIPIVECPVSPNIWHKRQSINFNLFRKDILLFLKGRTSDRDGIKLLKRIIKAYPELSFTVWCRGIQSAKLAMQELPHAQIVQNISEEELHKLYVGHKLFIFPSDFEGFGMPPVEALACGTVPILRHDVGAATMYARNNSNAIFWHKDNDLLSRRIISILQDNKRLKIMQLETQKSLERFNPRGYGRRIMKAAGLW